MHMRSVKIFVLSSRLCRPAVRKGSAFPLPYYLILRRGCASKRRGIASLFCEYVDGEAEPHRTAERQSRNLHVTLDPSLVSTIMDENWQSIPRDFPGFGRVNLRHLDSVFS